ncbi:hypothetical protein B0H15DRAFT_905027 [Mycena belliarum]|uniref:Vacuolar protein sorting-associated protein 13 second N-terminal domain-containing protein n=1 Tax=Mycena belliarum TaxID=1033014 RepID=A0AAD6XPP4_9AGAR|nr:hypothetical protein B0H15DRAFT_905027 [Mycena belliae]
MPMPRLLKRLSRKSLRKRTQSTASTVDEVLPTSKSAISESSFVDPAAAMPLNASSVYLPPTDPHPAARDGTITRYAAPVPPVTLTVDTAPEDEFSRNLLGAWTSATTDPKTSKIDKVLLKLENGVAGAMENQAKGVVIMTAVKTGLDAVGGMEAIEKGINTFMEGMPVLINALDEVAKLHPFIGVAVMAFKAVWALEQKRRDNDRKILALHMEMKEMMGVLTQLKNVKDADATAPDGSTIKGRMQIIVNATAEDIKACANACDTYIKKKLVVKILKGPMWEGKLVKFVGTFTKRRSEFEFALSIHTALGVDTANRTLGSVNETTQEMNMKMDMMMKMFQQFVAPEQKEMMRVVEQKGGLQACQGNDRILQELNDLEAKSSASAGGPSTAAKPGARPFTLEDLKDDLQTDIDSAVEKNMTVFTRKFEIQQRQLIDELSRVVAREGDRVISAVTAGPHDKIIDPNVHIIWKEMGWRGSVKTRHFVMALRDHFQEGHKGFDGQTHDHPEMSVAQADQWALEYIDVVRLQAIAEAFDDDASGFVTVAEVNTFTTMRPLGWSLPHWLAYAAVGHHQALQSYANKINALLAKIFAILPRILPVNKSSVNSYLDSIYYQVYTLTASVNACIVNEALQERFALYTAAEEARLKSNLEAVHYDIDALDTLALVTGEGRIDRFVLPLTLLLLERHFEIIRVSQTHVVHHDELWDAADTMNWVFQAIGTRFELLKSIFTQQKLDLKQQFKSFSHGLYEYVNDPNLLWDTKLVQEAEFPEYTYDDSVEAQDVDITKVSNYPVDQEPLDFEAYDPPKVSAPLGIDEPTPLAFAEGLVNVRWHGHMYWPSTSLWPSAGMWSMTLKPTSAQDGVQYFSATERANRGEFKITGECRAADEPGSVEFSFRRSFHARYQTQYFSGKWDCATETLTGTVGLEDDPSKHYSAFELKRIPPEYMCFWPSPAELEANRPCALWRFAIAAVRSDIRRERWAWSLIKERGENRRRFVELYIRSSGSTVFGTPLTPLEWQELGRIKKTFSTADSRFLHSLAETRIRATVEHNAACDVCDANIGGARITCLVCQMKDTFNTIDLCSNPECLTQRVMREDMQKAHLPHHDLMKVRRVVHMRQFGKTYRDAKEALKRARALFAGGTADTEDSEADWEDAEGHTQLPAKRLSQLPTNRLSRVPVLGISIPQTAFSGEHPTGPSCCGCKKPVSQPCWYCIQCGEASFICWECDAKGEVSFGDHDYHSHDLVRVTELIEEKDLSMEERLTAMEERFSKHEKTMEERLGRVEAVVDGRMAKMEELLGQLLAKLGRDESK